MAIIQIGRATITPKDLLADYPCFECLSEREMLAVFVLVANELLGTYTLPDQVDEMLSDSACFDCLSDKQKMQAIISAMSQVAYYGTDKTIDDIRNEIKCLLCAPPGLLKAAATRFIGGLVNKLGSPA